MAKKKSIIRAIKAYYQCDGAEVLELKKKCTDEEFSQFKMEFENAVRNAPGDFSDEVIALCGLDG